VREPYLTIVLASRNDNHGGGAVRRLRVVTKALLEQAERHGLALELIIVDWNPPTDKPPLKDCLSWPSSRKFCTVRIFEVPPAIHQRFEFSDKLPFFADRARNVGIRRARGKFVLANTMDLLYSEALIKFLASGGLRPDSLYRIDRYDVPDNVLRIPSVEAQLAYCEQNVLRIHGRYGLGPTIDNGEDALLHTNASGDFILLARELWHKLHGVPGDIDFIPMHADSMLCHMANRLGAKEIILKDPMRIYHIEHESFSQPNPSWLQRICSQSFIPSQLRDRVMYYAGRILPGKSRLEHLGFSAPYSVYLEMTEGKRPFPSNDDTWGLGQETLAESAVVL